MSTWLNFSIFGNVSRRKKTNHRRISDPQVSSNLDDEGIVKLLLYAIVSSSHEKIGSMGEEKTPEDSSISHISTLFLFSGRGKIIYCFLCWETVLLWYHLYPGVSTNVTVQVSKAWKFVISKHEIFSATKFDSKNCVFNHQSRGN